VIVTPYATYDQESDALYVRLAEGEVGSTVMLDDLRMIDYRADQTVIGIEFLEASEGVELDGVPFAETVEKAIGESGHQIRIFA